MATSINNTTSTGVSSPSDSLVITSPALSASSLSSSGFDFVAVGARSSNLERRDNAAAISATTPVRQATQSGEDSSFSDDDEIVWGLSESENLEGSTSTLGDVLSDDDFVVLSRARSPVSSSRDRTRTSGSAGSRTDTIRNVPLHFGPLVPRPSVNHPQGTDVDVEASKERNDKDIITSELATELAKLNVDTESLVGEASGTRTPVEGELRKTEPSTPGTSPKKKGKKAKKDRTPEEEELKKQRKKQRKEKKEREKQEKAAAKALPKGKEKEAVAKVVEVKEKKSKPKQPNESVIATSVLIAPGSSENISTATLVPPSNATTASRITPESAALPEEAAPVPILALLPSPPLKPVTTPTPVGESPKKKIKKIKKVKKVKKVKATELTTLTQHNTVIAEKVSEQTYDSKSTPTPYDEAVNYITSYISNAPARHDPTCHLTLLQSLIIELGLIKDISLLPRSIKAAKKLIKPRVFLNIKDYITKRHEGPKVVQDLMFPTRSALVKDMKKRRNFASLQWIKKCGLQDLLVGVFHR